MNFQLALVLAAGPGAVVPFVRKLTPISESETDEEPLIREASTGRRSAQHTLYLRYYERVRSRIVRLLGCSSEVDDVLQDTFVAAFRDLAQLTDPTRFGAWVCGIAAHQVHRRLRRHQLLSRLGFVHLGWVKNEMEPALHQSVDPKAGPETQLLLKQLDQALARLGPRRRVAWILRYVEGCSLDEVAEQCRTSLATVKRDIASAEALLHAHFDERNTKQGQLR